MIRNMAAPTGQLGARLIRATSPRNLTDSELNKLESDLKRRINPNSWQQQTLGWLKNNVHPEIPSLWRKLVLGHDQHLYTTSVLRARINEGHGWVHPYKRDLLIPEQRLSPIIGDKLVTTGFRDDIVDNLITEVAAFGDYKFHEVGTSNTAPTNTDTTLNTTSGITRVSGTQVENAANIYETVATITADTGETWEEWGLFNLSSGGIMLDHDNSFSIAVTASDQVQFTYDLTVNAES